MEIEKIKENLLNDKNFMDTIVNYTNEKFGENFETSNYDKRKITKEIIKLLKNVKYGDWEKIKQIIDNRYTIIKNESNFSCDKVTLNRIESWF